MEHSQRKMWSITPGSRLSGSPTIHGNKNAALPCLAASLLLPPEGELTLENVPHISDVTSLCGVLESLGITTYWSGPQQMTLKRTAAPAVHPDIPPEHTGRIRGSITLLGPLAGMYRSFRLPKPGGDKIGGRPIGAHITALSDLGITTTQEPGYLVCRRDTDLPAGGTVMLTEQSVTATLMLLLYSGFLPADQSLTILDAACEPHVVTLCGLLEQMGAHIEGVYSNLLRISWPDGRHAPSVALRLDDDFMEATTYAIAAAVTSSDIHIPFTNAAIYLFLIDRYLGWMGVSTILERDHWTILGSQSSRVIDPMLTAIKAEPWPRFPTDVMSMFIVLATQCTGTLKFVEYMYDDRFGFVQSLRDIGARIDSLPPHAIVVHGPSTFVDNELFVRPDIRSGAAMLIAALASPGTTVLHDRGGVIERGYQQLPESLAALGAHIVSRQVSFD